MAAPTTAAAGGTAVAAAAAEAAAGNQFSVRALFWQNDAGLFYVTFLYTAFLDFPSRLMPCSGHSKLLTHRSTSVVD